MALAEVLVPLPAHPAGLPWPTEAWPRGELPVGLDRGAFEEATSSLFEGVGRGGLRDTRALLIVRGGRIVYERYAEGFGPTSRFQSWSMAKSVTQSLVGILVRMGKLVVDAPAPVPAWQTPGDPRGKVSLDDLLHMTSGLGNEDGFDTGALFVGEVLFGRGARDPAGFAEAVDVVHPPGTHWAYSTGTSMIVAAIAGRAMGEGERDRLGFMRRELFLPLGMKTVVPEFDSAGQFMGGGFFHASAEDWARFGYLYLRDGVWEDRRILPEGWVDYSRTPAPADNNGVHGAHLWVNAEPAEGQWKMYPGAPASAFGAEGSEHQAVVMVPTHDLVVVRLGTLQATDYDESRQRIGRLIASFPPLGVR
jgi:CubicO group peptidase (beta-lactamase class C family)